MKILKKQMARKHLDWEDNLLAFKDSLAASTRILYTFVLMRIGDSTEKTLMLGKTEDRGEGGDRGCDGWMASEIHWT